MDQSIFVKPSPIKHQAHWSLFPILSTLSLLPEVENYLTTILPQETQNMGPLSMFGAEDIAFHHEHLIPNGLAVLQWGFICIGAFEESMLILTDTKDGQLLGLSLDDLADLGIIWRETSRQIFSPWSRETIIKASIKRDKQGFDQSILTLLYGVKHGLEDIEIDEF